MTLLLRDADVATAVDVPRLMDGIESALVQESQGRITIVPRQNASYGSGNYRHMAAILPGDDAMGFKIFHGSAASGMRYMVGLYSCGDGELLCLLDASYLTAARTGAVTGVAYKHLLGPRAARRLAVIGSGLEARTNLEAILAVRAPEEVAVFSPNPRRRAAFVREVQARGVRTVDAASAAEAMLGADIVLAATNTRRSASQIAVEGGWLEPDALLLSIGSTLPDLREVDAAAYTAAEVIVVDAPGQAEEESGDLIAALRAEPRVSERIRSLADIVAGSQAAPLRGLTAFKSVGTGAQDVAAALAVYRTARDLGLGQDVGQLLSTKVFTVSDPAVPVGLEQGRKDTHARIG